VVLAGYISSGITAIILGYWTKDHYQGLQTLKAQLPALKKTETPNDSPKNTNTTLIFSRVSPIEDIKSDPVPSLDNHLTF